jgi:hypothetical protein
MDIVTIPKTSELLLSSGIPTVKSNTAAISEEVERVNLDTDGGCRQNNKSKSVKSEKLVGYDYLQNEP